MSDKEREYYRQKYKTLADIPDIGPSTISKLHELGIKTVEALGTAHESELITTGISDDLATKLIKSARKAFAIEFVTGDELVKLRADRRKITTGCTSLDRLLTVEGEDHGGLETESITEFYGEFGAGKSQLCHQLAVSCQLPEDRGGINGACLYIDTEQVFRPGRVLTIAKRLKVDNPLSRIVYAEAYTSAHQMVLLEAADEVIKDHNVKLVIIDSLISHFRSEYPGRELLAPRQQLISKHLHKLIRLARSFNLAAVITNQVTAVPDVYAGRDPVPVGGNIVGHLAHSRIYLRKGRGNIRIAKVVASPFLPVSEAPMRITDNGIVSDEDIIAEGENDIED